MIRPTRLILWQTYHDRRHPQIYGRLVGYGRKCGMIVGPNGQRRRVPLADLRAWNVNGIVNGGVKE